jgi:hypothetical protein
VQRPATADGPAKVETREVGLYPLVGGDGESGDLVLRDCGIVAVA